MKPETAGKIKYGGWGLFCGAVIAIIIGFGWGGWTTAATTKAIAADAILESQAAICVAQFMNDPNHKEVLKKIGELDTWKRAEFIEKEGWNKMPGQKEADYNVSRACADGIELLIN